MDDFYRKIQNQQSGSPLQYIEFHKDHLSIKAAYPFEEMVPNLLYNLVDNRLIVHIEFNYSNGILQSTKIRDVGELSTMLKGHTSFEMLGSCKIRAFFVENDIEYLRETIDGFKSLKWLQASGIEDVNAVLKQYYVHADNKTYKEELATSE